MKSQKNSTCDPCPPHSSLPAATAEAKAAAEAASIAVAAWMKEGKEGGEVVEEATDRWREWGVTEGRDVQTDRYVSHIYDGQDTCVSSRSNT